MPSPPGVTKENFISTQPPIQWVPGQSDQRAKLTTHLHLVLCGAIPPLPNTWVHLHCVALS